MRRVFKIRGAVQHYQWGGYSFIPELLGFENKEGEPFAEYWLGAHPNHPSFKENTGEKLSEIIYQNGAVLGEEVQKKFSSLPFLLKVLDVRQMLSIQVHPSREVAAEEYRNENERGISLTAPHRNYKDENHKPELMVALSDFWLLHGFKGEDTLRKTLAAIPSFSFMLSLFDQKGYKGLYGEVMTMSQQKVNEILEPVIKRILPLYNNNEFTKSDEDFWAARAALDFCQDGNYDRGIFSIYFFNLVHLKKGEGIYQPQGMPHAYLEGQNIEVMANSDNVLRAGLTDKHIDVPELLRHVDFRATHPAIIDPVWGRHKIFSSPAEEFELHQYFFDEEKQKVHTASAEIWLVLSGALTVLTEEEKIEVKRGEALFISAGTSFSASSISGSEVFRVTVPVDKN